LFTNDNGRERESFDCHKKLTKKIGDKVKAR
jgi:hypothetical protein